MEYFITVEKYTKKEALEQLKSIITDSSVSFHGKGCKRIFLYKIYNSSINDYKNLLKYENIEIFN